MTAIASAGKIFKRKDVRETNLTTQDWAHTIIGTARAIQRCWEEVDEQEYLDWKAAHPEYFEEPEPPINEELNN